jgi:hypothetical protein
MAGGLEEINLLVSLTTNDRDNNALIIGRGSQKGKERGYSYSSYCTAGADAILN